MRAILFALMLSACAQAGVQAYGPSQTSALSPLAVQIRADQARLDQALHDKRLVSAGIGETADLGGGLIIRPLEVIEDSRCPSNVECVWAGRLRLRADVSGTEAEFTMGQALATPNGSVMLTIASPGAWAAWPTAEIGTRPAYRFGFRREA